MERLNDPVCKRCGNKLTESQIKRFIVTFKHLFNTGQGEKKGPYCSQKCNALDRDRHHNLTDVGYQKAMEALYGEDWLTEQLAKEDRDKNK